jgi:hypothetical protein
LTFCRDCDKFDKPIRQDVIEDSQKFIEEVNQETGVVPAKLTESLKVTAQRLRMALEVAFFPHVYLEIGDCSLPSFLLRHNFNSDSFPFNRVDPREDNRKREITDYFYLLITFVSEIRLEVATPGRNGRLYRGFDYFDSDLMKYITEHFQLSDSRKPMGLALALSRSMIHFLNFKIYRSGSKFLFYNLGGKDFSAFLVCKDNQIDSALIGRGIRCYNYQILDNKIFMDGLFHQALVVGRISEEKFTSFFKRVRESFGSLPDEEVFKSFC